MIQFLEIVDEAAGEKSLFPMSSVNSIKFTPIDGLKENIEVWSGSVKAEFKVERGSYFKLSNEIEEDMHSSPVFTMFCYNLGKDNGKEKQIDSLLCDLDFSIRELNALGKVGIRDMRSLLSHSRKELRAMGVGPKTSVQIEQTVERYGLKLKEN